MPNPYIYFGELPPMRGRRRVVVRAHRNHDELGGIGWHPQWRLIHLRAEPRDDLERGLLGSGAWENAGPEDG